MREITYLSPTSISKWEEGPHIFYKRYLADNRPPHDPQTKAMSIGSAFDAFVKHHLVRDLTGRAAGRFDLDTLLTAQVEAHNREWARVNGEQAFAAYVRSGMYASLLGQMKKSSDMPRFEFTAVGVIGERDNGVEGTIEGVPLLGKPDAAFSDTAEFPVILDWKVNGWCSKSAVSPVPGFYRVRDGWTGHKQSRSHNSVHKNFLGTDLGGGLIVNGYQTLDQVHLSWARQLTIYSWLAGFEVGAPFKVAVDQLACAPCPNDDGREDDQAGFPLVRIAQHRHTVGKPFQDDLLRKIHEIWETIHSGWIFRELTENESRKMQGIYDRSEIDHDDNWDEYFGGSNTYRG